MSRSSHAVWAFCLWAAVDSAARAGLATSGLFEGLPFDATSVRRLRQVPWEHYGRIVERIEAAAGGPEAAARLLEDNYHHVSPELRAVAASLLSPKLLLRFMCEVSTPILLPPVQAEFEDLGGGTVRISCALRAGAKPCAAWFRGMVGVLRGMPRHLDLPAAEVAAELGESHGTYEIALPASRTLAARAVSATRAATMRLVLGYGDDGTPLRASLGSEGADDLASRLDEAARVWALTQKQRDVITLLVRGQTNKEIARRLGCAENTVELHVTQALRKSGATSRSRLIAKFWSSL